MSTRRNPNGRSSPRDRRLGIVTLGLLAMAVAVGAAPPTADSERQRAVTQTRNLWQHVTSKPSEIRTFGIREVAVRPVRARANTLDHDGMRSLLSRAPLERTLLARVSPLVLDLPDPNGDFQRFTLADSPIMEAGLAARHPEIKTYRGRGIDDPTATIRADMTPLGFHASVRSAKGAWYIDPYYHLDTSLYVTYYARDLKDNPHGDFVERELDSPEITADHVYYRQRSQVTLHGVGFADNAAITITVSGPQKVTGPRTVKTVADGLGSFDAVFDADPADHLGPHAVEASDGAGSATASYEVVAKDVSLNPPTGDVLRTYRLALITDPGYATFFGGSPNVTAAKVALINRVVQVYEDDLSITMVLVANNDLLNFDTWAQAIGPNGPCGAAPCFTQAQATGCSSTTRARFVIGQIIGASNYDIGHLGLGQPGGGVANLGVVGRSNKAGGCTGIPTPVGDFYAVDYVAHEMGHQYSGNHPFNGNQLNCSGGNRSAANSVEPGSGSSVMAYAGICLTDDLQRHSDPYFCQRSQQEMSTYTSSNQAAINEVQTASLRHFGGGNEVQVVTFGPGFAPVATIQPLSLAINAAPSATSRGGAEEAGNTVTIATGSAHTLRAGDVVTIAGVAVADYNGTWTVTAVPSSRSFQYTNPVSGLATSGGGTVTLAVPGATESGNTVTIHTAAVHVLSVGDMAAISGVGVAGYNGTFTVTAVPSPRSFEYTNPTSGLASSGGGSATRFSPFQVRIGGNDSSVIGGSGLAYSNANIQSAINAISGFAGTVTVSGAASTGFTVTYGGASAGLDVPSLEIVNLSCGGCFAAVEETNHGGANDSFTLNYNGSVSAPIVNGTNYTAAGLAAALTSILPAGATFTLNAFGGGNISGLNNTGFQVTYTGSLAATNVPVLLALQDFSAGASGFVGETDKGGPVDNKGGLITPTGNMVPIVTAPAQFTIPLRTPFALTGSAFDSDGDTLLYSWEQNDRGGTAGTSLLNNTKTNGALFAMFPVSGQISDADSLMYDSPGENHLTTNPTRVFPDLQQILDNNTNADSGFCPGNPEIAPPVPQSLTECFSEFLPTLDYVGFAGVNASPLSLHFRFTARDNNGGASSADTTLLLATNAGPFRVTSPDTGGAWPGGSTQTVTWDKANTDIAPVSAANVKISLSTDGGHTYPYVLAASTPNDGTHAVTVPNVATTHARVKVEAVDNIFFDVSNADFTISAAPVVTNDAPPGGAFVQYSDSLSPTVTISATDADTFGSNLTAAASGLPAGMSLAIASTSAGTTLPGTRTWTVTGATTAAPGSYPVTVTVSDDTGNSAATSFTIVVTREDADATYTGDMLAFTPPGGSSADVVLRATVRDSSLIPAYSDSEPGDVRNATVTFKEGTTTLCGPLPVALIDGALTTGTASCTKTLAVGAHLIDIDVANYYVGTGAGMVEVAQPDGSFITGGGALVIGHSAGTYPAASGSRMNFGFNVKYNKNLKNLQGHFNSTYSGGGRTFQIKTTALESLGIALRTAGGAPCDGPPSSTCFGLADFRSKANLTDITDPFNPIPLGGNLSLQVTITDKGDPGTSDSIGVTLWNGNTLVFSSEWSGAQTLERTLDGGNTVVH